MQGMNLDIRQAVREAMKQKGISQEALAQSTGINRVYITRMLSGRASDAPKNWQKVLDALSLQLTVEPAQAPAGAEWEAQ